MLLSCVGSHIFDKTKVKFRIHYSYSFIVFITRSTGLGKSLNSWYTS